MLKDFSYFKPRVLKEEETNKKRMYWKTFCAGSVKFNETTEVCLVLLSEELS